LYIIQYYVIHIRTLACTHVIFACIDASASNSEALLLLLAYISTYRKLTTSTCYHVLLHSQIGAVDVTKLQSTWHAAQQCGFSIPVDNQAYNHSNKLAQKHRVSHIPVAAAAAAAAVAAAVPSMQPSAVSLPRPQFVHSLSVIAATADKQSALAVHRTAYSYDSSAHSSVPDTRAMPHINYSSQAVGNEAAMQQQQQQQHQLPLYARLVQI
jgi:hypothetical protein